jgi:hypothetical protein
MTKNIPRRIPKANIITGPKPIISESDAVWLGENAGIKGTSVSSIGSGINLVNSNISSVNSIPESLNTKIGNSVIVEPDTVSMTDIESVTYEQYYDSVSKLVKYKTILKIRNSSLNKLDVEGVDARIYNPNA